MIKCFKVLGIVLPMVAIMPHSTLAREFAEIYTQCGLGAMIAPKHEVVAAVTNVTWDLGTTAISTNISCPESCAGGKEKMAAFIYDSQELLLNELAGGDGRYIDALVELSGVAPEKKAAFVKSLRSEVSDTMISDDLVSKTRYQKAESFYNIVVKVIDAQS